MKGCLLAGRYDPACCLSALYKETANEGVSERNANGLGLPS
jgi:hypothetical protein